MHHSHRHFHSDHAAAFMAGGRHGGGFERFGAGFMGAGLGGRGFRSGRKLGSSELQLLLLALLAENPSHGYELIKALEQRSGGFYAPSPGMVYPALTYLEELGHASVTVEGAKKRYAITEEGSAYLNEHRALADSILSQLARIGSRMDKVRRAFDGEAAPADSEDGDEAGPFSRLRGARDLNHARIALKRALHAKLHGGSPEEFQRVTEILKRAASEILGEPQTPPKV